MERILGLKEKFEQQNHWAEVGFSFIFLSPPASPLSQLRRREQKSGNGDGDGDGDHQPRSNMMMMVMMVMMILVMMMIDDSQLSDSRISLLNL